MKVAHFDLNDIEHEPTDQDLESLMDAVAVEAARKAKLAEETLMIRLRAEIAEANLRPGYGVSSSSPK